MPRGKITSRIVVSDTDPTYKAAQLVRYYANKDVYKAKMKAYYITHHEAIRIKNQLRSAAKKDPERNNPFYMAPPLFQLTDTDKKKMERMSELISIGCVPKKTKGINFYEVTGKDKMISLLKDIGFNQSDSWVSRSWYKIPMKLLGWNDINQFKINRPKMIAYGHLVYIQNIPKDIVKCIISYL
jgi:hypothetical protein